MAADELKRLPLFEQCNDEAIASLLSAPHRRKQFDRGQTLMQAGDAVVSVMAMTEGSVVTRMSGDEGREVVIDRLAAPCLLAPAFVFATDNCIPVDVVAEGDCTVWMLNRE